MKKIKKKNLSIPTRNHVLIKKNWFSDFCKFTVILEFQN